MAKQLPLIFEHRPAFGYEDFIVNPSNEEAVLWLDKWPEWDNFALSIYGAEGCGKTHLAHVFSLMVEYQDSGINVKIISPTELKVDNVAELVDKYKCIILEDADRGVDEEALFHLYNMLKEEHGTLLLTARIPPSRWNVLLPDLSSRLRTVIGVPLNEPDDNLYASVLVKHFSDRQIMVGKEVVEYLISHGERSFSFAKRIVAEADNLSLSEKRRITIPLIKQVISNIPRA